MTRQEAIDTIKPILEKGKPINDIIFLSKKMSYNDIVFMLWFLRPVESKKRFLSWKKENDSYYGMPDDSINNMLNEPVFGGDGIQQLVFGCIAALDVYTEEEILTVLDVQRKYARAD